VLIMVMLLVPLDVVEINGFNVLEPLVLVDVNGANVLVPEVDVV
jgi:hypothetical protein